MTTSDQNSTLPAFEEAKLCPKCGKPGEDRKSTPAPNMPRGTTLHFIYCMTELCPWFDTCWMVQVNVDGTIPEKKDHTFTKKEYVGFEGHDQRAMALIEELKGFEQMKQNGQNPEIRPR